MLRRITGQVRRYAVQDAPISEAGIVGTGVGAAIVGMRPIVEIMYADFLLVCLDQICNQAAKINYMSGGQIHVPLVIRTPWVAGEPCRTAFPMPACMGSQLPRAQDRPALHRTGSQGTPQKRDP